MEYNRLNHLLIGLFLLAAALLLAPYCNFGADGAEDGAGSEPSEQRAEQKTGSPGTEPAPGAEPAGSELDRLLGRTESGDH